MASRQKACASLHGILSPDWKGIHLENKVKFQVCGSEPSTISQNITCKMSWLTSFAPFFQILDKGIQVRNTQILSQSHELWFISVINLIPSGLASKTHAGLVNWEFEMPQLQNRKVAHVYSERETAALTCVWCGGFCGLNFCHLCSVLSTVQYYPSGVDDWQRSTIIVYPTILATNMRESPFSLF